MPSLNRRRALTALAVGVVAPGALAACMSNGNKPGSGAAEDALPAPTRDVRTRRRGGRRRAHRAHRRRGQRRLVPEGQPDQRRRQGRRRRAQPRPHRVHRHRAARLRRRPTPGAARSSATTARRYPSAASFTTVNPDTQVNGQFQLSDGQTVGVAAPIILQFDASIAEEDRAGREGAHGHHHAARRGQLGLAARRGRRLAGALAHQGVLPAGHHGARRREALRRAVRRRRLRRGRLDAGLHHRPPPGGQGRGVVAPDPGASPTRACIMDLPCSYGEGDLDRNVTRSGIHVVTEKYEDFYMTNPAAGYTNVHERFAVRISNNGEFIHANPASSARRATPTSPTAASTCPPRTPSSTSTPRSTATRSRSPAPGSSCPTPTATSGTGRCRGTSGRRCRRCRHAGARRRSPAPRPPRRRMRRSRSAASPAADGYTPRLRCGERSSGLVARHCSANGV